MNSHATAVFRIIKLPEDIPEVYRKIIESCLAVRADRRPSLNDIIDSMEIFEPKSPLLLYEEAKAHEKENNFRKARIYYQQAIGGGCAKAKANSAAELLSSVISNI
jgi:hypothetical protein